MNVNHAILHWNGAYQVINRDTLMPVYKTAVTIPEVVAFFRDKYGAKIFESMHDMFEDAQRFGTTDLPLDTIIERCPMRLDHRQFINRFLTL